MAFYDSFRCTYSNGRESTATYTYQRPGNYTVSVYISNSYYNDEPITAELPEVFRVVQEIQGLTMHVCTSHYLLVFKSSMMGPVLTFHRSGFNLQYLLLNVVTLVMVSDGR